MAMASKAKTTLLMLLLLLLTLLQAVDCVTDGWHMEPLQPLGNLTGCSVESDKEPRGLLACAIGTQPESSVLQYTPSVCRRLSGCRSLVPDASAPSEFWLPSGTRQVLMAVATGSGVLSYLLWAGSYGCNDSLLLLPAGEQPDVAAWRSCWVDRLPELMALLGRRRLRLELLTGGSVVTRIEFDASAADLNRYNWFASGKILSSAPQQLSRNPSDYNRFEINSTSCTTSCRSFHINRIYAGCANDAGFLIVTDNGDGCAWATMSTGKKPAVEYTLNGGLWDSNAKMADFLVISVG